MAMPTGDNSWTLEKEMLQLSGAGSLPSAFYKIGLLPNPDASFEYAVLADWHRSGAETYMYIFTVRSGPNWTKPVALKACVATTFGTTTEAVLSRWIRRRVILRAAGVATPHLYFSGAGLTVEEYLGSSLPSVISQSTLGQAIHLAAALDRERFRPIGPFNDLHIKDEVVYMVDFGADLGEPGVCTEPRYCFHKLLIYLRDMNLAHDLRQSEFLYLSCLER